MAAKCVKCGAKITRDWCKVWRNAAAKAGREYREPKVCEDCMCRSLGLKPGSAAEKGQCLDSEGPMIVEELRGGK